MWCAHTHTTTHTCMHTHTHACTHKHTHAHTHTELSWLLLSAAAIQNTFHKHIYFSSSFFLLKDWFNRSYTMVTHDSVFLLIGVHIVLPCSDWLQGFCAGYGDGSCGDTFFLFLFQSKRKLLHCKGGSADFTTQRPQPQDIQKEPRRWTLTHVVSSTKINMWTLSLERWRDMA